MTVGPPISELHLEDAPCVKNVPGPRTKRFLDRQREIESSSVSYPKSIPIGIDIGRGATIRDLDGNVFLDFFAGMGVLPVGHSNPYVLEAVHEQLDKLTHSLDFPTEARIEMVELLDEIAPGELSGHNRVVFGGPSGSDAVEASIKLARHATNGTDLIAFRGGYHGRTAGSLSITAKNAIKQHELPLLPNVTFLPYPYPFHYDSPEQALEVSLREVRETLENPYSGISDPAGIWVEAIQGDGGAVVPPDGFLSRLREIATENNIPLIVDEIQTGFGRTGRWFAAEHEEVTPDIMTMAKGIGGVGLPLSATMYTEELEPWGTAKHSGTFRGNVAAMRAGVRAIEYIEKRELLAHARELGERIRSQLADATSTNPCIGEVRGRGLMIGIEFVDRKGSPSEQIANDVKDYCYKNGLLIVTSGWYGNVIRLLPPLVLTRELADTGVSILVDGIEDATKRRGR